MKVFKFGGASVKDAEAVKNVAEILRKYDENIIVVVSAMGKTTNALEKLTKAYFYKEGDVKTILSEIKDFHFDILKKLFADENHKIYTETNNAFVEIEWVIEEPPIKDYDFTYDQIVSVGELLSTRIVSAWLNEDPIKETLDKTVSPHRGDRGGLPERKISPSLRGEVGGGAGSVIVTQGFIGVTSENYTTTLGREGSDYTGAIIAYLTNAEEVVIWKDVPGVLNADPKWFKETQKLNEISYHEAIELSFFGATIIHPKTIKPLQNKNIPLKVKSFYSPDEEGTAIVNVKDLSKKTLDPTNLIPSFIFKTQQVLISILPRDFSFIVEENLSDVFSRFAKYGIKVNMMQHSAISFSICVDGYKNKVPQLIEALQKDFKVLYNEDVELMTVRHYDQPTIDKLTKGKKIFVEQKSRHTARFVVR